MPKYDDDAIGKEHELTNELLEMAKHLSPGYEMRLKELAHLLADNDVVNMGELTRRLKNER